MSDTESILKTAVEKVLTEGLGAGAFELSEYRGELTAHVDRKNLVKAAKLLRDAPELRFDMMAYMTAIDWLLHKRIPRFEVAYNLFSTQKHHRMRLKSDVPEEDCTSPSLCPVWSSCNFMEREAYDMFGIEFQGHPDLRRILMPDGWIGWPLRKDFPMGGSKSFYFKRDTDPYVGEPPGLVPRLEPPSSDRPE